MALLIADSFEHEDSNRYDSVVVTRFSPLDARHGRGLRIGDWAGGFNSGGYFGYNLASSGDTIIVGFALYPISIGTSQGSNTDTMRITDGAGTTFATLYVGTNGWSVNGVSLYLDAVGGTVTTNTWYWVELKMKFANAGGTCELRINGATAGSEFTGDTSVSDLTSAGFIDWGGGSDNHIGDARIDDLVVMDGSGTAANDFIGDSWVQSQAVNADTLDIQLTGSDGDQTDNYDMLNETIPASTDFVGGSTATHRDYYELESLSTTAAQWTVHGAQVWATLGKESGGSAFGRMLAREGGTTSLGDSIGLSTTYIYERITLTNSPTGSTWTAPTFNDLEVGFEVRAST